MPSDRAKLIFNGALVLLVGLLCGIPTTVESLGGGSIRDWHTAHEALIMMGIWIVSMSAVLPSLVLDAREAKGLRWSLIGMGHAFAVALVLQGITGARAFEPGRTPIAMITFFAALAGILGAVVATLITLKGARAALKSG